MTLDKVAGRGRGFHCDGALFPGNHSVCLRLRVSAAPRAGLWCPWAASRVLWAPWAPPGRAVLCGQATRLEARVAGLTG